MTLKLQRIENSIDGTFGIIRMGEKKFHTLELPWANNEHNKSSIPLGKYECMYTWSPSFQRRLYLVCDVPGRVGIRIHPANTIDQLNGCIALGLQLGMIKGKRALLQSRTAVSDFEKLLEMKPFTLEVCDGIEVQVA
jgi:hypothetical protein